MESKRSTSIAAVERCSEMTHGAPDRRGETEQHLEQREESGGDLPPLSREPSDEPSTHRLQIDPIDYEQPLVEPQDGQTKQEPARCIVLPQE